VHSHLVRRTLVVAASIVTASSLSAPGAVAAPNCVPAGADVVAASGPLAVYTSGSTKLLACRGDRGPRRLVGYTANCEAGGACERDRVLAVTGSCVALQSYTTDRYHNDAWALRVSDVRLNRSWSYALRLVPSSAETVDAATVNPVPSIVLASGCAVAWINGLGAGQPTEVRTADGHGRLLRARSSNVDLTSLRRVPGGVMWMEAGLSHSAPLSGAPRWHRPPYV
jgi:hypothetical protein